MFFKRDHKPPLEYALDFVELAGETARRYLHDKNYVPTQQVMAQLKELKRTMGVHHSAMGYIIRTLEERMSGGPSSAPGDSPPDDWYDK